MYPLFPFSDEYAILEIEVRDIDEKIVLPALDIVKEVTDDPPPGVMISELAGEPYDFAGLIAVTPADMLAQGIVMDMRTSVPKIVDGYRLVNLKRKKVTGLLAIPGNL